MQSSVCNVVLTVEYTSGLPKIEFKHDLEGTILDMRLRYEQGYVCTSSLTGIELA